MIAEQTIIKVYIQNANGVNWARHFLGRPSKAKVIQTLNHDGNESLPELVDDYWTGERHVECMYAGVRVGIITVEEYGQAVEVEE